ncbi:hypothetical protein C1H46_031175 [Malus baccata]|uniref:Uncharacterized protein n=1 Tax=Malus baccata TaxID=106549 RepID=A0A540L9T7_MALBA|nr:hypothetical protein C1H46_031175 [Malus baccata]
MLDLKPSWIGEDEQDCGKINGRRYAQCSELHRCISTAVAARLLDDVEFLSRRSSDDVSKSGLASKFLGFSRRE